MSETHWEQNYNAMFAKHEELRLRCASLEAALLGIHADYCDVGDGGCHMNGQECSIHKALSGTPSALRALVEKSFNAGWRMGGEMEPGAYADRILSLPGAFLLDGFRDQLNEANAQLKAERAHADRLAEALRQYVDKWAHVIAPAEYHEKSEADLAAHAARRAGEGGSK